MNLKIQKSNDSSRNLKNDRMNLNLELNKNNKSNLLITFLLLIIISINNVYSLPKTSSSSFLSSSDISSSSSETELNQKSLFCKSSSNIIQLYNIGPDVFIALNSRSIFRYDTIKKQISYDKFDNHQIFGKNHFEWVDTVINLDGICRIKNCENTNDLENIHLVIGHRILENGDKGYGMAIYEYLPNKKNEIKNKKNDGEEEEDISSYFKLIDKKRLIEDRMLIDKLNRTGITVNPYEQDGLILMGQFWPKINGILSGNLYVFSGLFVPWKSQLFFSLYETTNPIESRKIINHNLIDFNSKWNDLNEELFKTTRLIAKNRNTYRMKDNYIIGMFNYVPKQRTFALTKSQQILETIWTSKGNVQFVPKGSLRTLLNCYDNSTELEMDAPSTILDTEPTTPQTTTTTTATTTTTTTTTKIPVVSKEESSLPELPSPVSPIKVVSNPDEIAPDSNESDIDENDDEVPIMKQNLKETEANFNDLDQQSDDPNSVGRHHHSSEINKGTLAEASARGSFNHDRGALWTFVILSSVLAILAVLIVIPILIIKCRTRNNNKMSPNSKKNGMNGNHHKSYSNGNKSPETIELINSKSIQA